MIDKSTFRKRQSDLAKDAQAGFDTAPEDDARLQQSRPEPDDEFSRRADETIKFMRQHQPYFWRLDDPDELAKLKAELRAAAMRDAGLKPEMQDTEPPEEEPFDSDKFWNNPDEIQKAVKKVRPPRL